MTCVRLVAAAALSAGLVFTSSALAQAAPSITIELKPSALNGEVRRVEIRQTLTGYAGAAGKPLFEVPARVTLKDSAIVTGTSSPSMISVRWSS